MTRTPAGFVAFLLIAAAISAPRPAPASPAAMVAVNRCNAQMIGTLEDQIRGYDAHPPRGDAGDLQKRFNDINEILAALGQERNIVDSVCSGDAAKAPLFAQLGTVAAWGLALESDIALRLDQPCTPAAKAIGQALIAQAWLDLANVVNASAPATPAPDVASMAPRVQTRAAGLSFTLPAYADTSAYWRDQIAAQAKAAVQACATPAPSPSPTSGVLRIVRK
ncbi:MAG: hypothetical protein JO175_01230 [Candidatus Eremiobacteraeota bacterium]|nr:hypothetical protein [Candidatus Eremiobacteraeota bacterium]